MPPPEKRRLATIRCWIALAAAVLPACRQARPQVSPPSSELGILLIVLDACRADKIGCYGFERETTPRLDALAREPESTIFRRHYVQSTWTKPSVASLFTGMFVHQHRVTLGPRPLAAMAAGKDASRRFETQVFDAGFNTLAERLRELGFATFAVGTSHHLNAEYGFDQGFGEYYSPANLPADDPGLVRKFVELFRGTAGRSFGYLHLRACHNPFPAQLRDAEYLRRHGFEYDEPARVAAGVDLSTRTGREMIPPTRAPLNADDVRFLNLIYEAQLRWTDRELVGPLLDALRETGRYDSTLILITADHGEELFDHGGFAHGHAQWEELIRVPLIVKFPKGRRPPAMGPEVTALSRSIDLLPSLLKFAGGEMPAGLPGQAMFDGSFPTFALAEMADETGKIVEWALIRGDTKLIAGDNRSRLFDLASDPKEQRNLASAHPGEVKAMRRFVSGLVAADGGADPTRVKTELTPEAMERLRSLGYIQ